MAEKNQKVDRNEMTISETESWDAGGGGGRPRSNKLHVGQRLGGKMKADERRVEKRKKKTPPKMYRNVERGR